MQVGMNANTETFIVQHGERVSCIAFGTAQRDASFIAQKLQRLDLIPTRDEYGTAAAFIKYRRAVEAWTSSVFGSDTWCTPGTPRPVQQELEKYRYSRKPLRVFYGDHVTGRDWMLTTNVVGVVDRRNDGLRLPMLTGPGKRPEPLNSESIVRILDAATGAEVYRTPRYVVPQLVLHRINEQDLLDKCWQAAVTTEDGGSHGLFRSVEAAHDYVAFITGQSPTMREHLEQLAA